MKARLLGLLVSLLVIFGLVAAALAFLLPAMSPPGAIVTPAESLVLLGLILLTAALVVVAWWRGRRQKGRELEAREDLERIQREVDERDRRLQERDERLRERDQHLSGEEERVRGLEERLEEERRTSSRLGEARRAEREYSRQLRAELSRVVSERGLLGRTDDIPQLIVRLAVSLLEADKGLLLSRRDRDGDGDLDLLASEGFAEDPQRSELVQRFAHQVIERDTTVREDTPLGAPDGGPEATEQGIENLVAIPLYVRDEFGGVVVCANRRGGFEELDDETLVALGDQAGSLLDNARLRGELRGAYLSTIALLAEALEAKDPFLRSHSEQVSDYVSAVAEQLDVPEHKREELLFASLLHDIGKIGISERILLKPTALTAEERSLIELHPRIGCRLIEQVPALRPLAAAILHHHERWDGRGYPSRLTGPQIPIEARILAVADSFSAMTAERPYRGRMPLEAACAELEACAGTQFDPRIVAAFVAEVRRRPRVPEGGLAAALNDPEIRLRRRDQEPLIGFGSLAVTDSLTLLYSHGYFRELLDAEARNAQLHGEPFAVALLELAGLEEENRRNGFSAGDSALRTAARAVQGVAVRYRGTAARHGGARLAFTLPGVGAEAAARIGEEVTRALPEALRPRFALVESWPEEGGDEALSRALGALGERPATASHTRAG
ncbi:MAG: HD domain-containing protein [Actinomycetota bacterium]|nr:HD domain-containing protein [Actinomycetota bacterium]